MANSSTRKSEFLGMPFGTANGRLRKMILFNLLKRLNENVCYKCKESITRLDELSIEHILPWEGVSVDLYWNIDNIAFSHLRCNRPHKPSGGSSTAKRIIPPTGYAWCAGCKDFRCVGLFGKGGRWNGLREYCNPCRKQGRGR